MEYPSKLLERAVEAFTRLPGVGRKTALRLVLHLLKQDEGEALEFGEAVIRMKKDIKFCKTCHNISDRDMCSICTSKRRDHSTICVVEDLRDVMAIESTEQYNGVFHVLNGLISPMDGIGPDNLNIDSLIRRVREQEVKEVIFALSTTMEGDTTVFYISRQMNGTPVKLSSIARGVSIGGELEYTDEVTLARSIAERVPYSQ